MYTLSKLSNEFRIENATFKTRFLTKIKVIMYVS